MTSPNWQERLSPHRLNEMRPHERIVYYEFVELPILRARDFSFEEALDSVNLGMAYLDCHRIDEAIHYLAHAARTFEDSAKSEWLAKSLVDLGLALRYKNEPGEALSAYRRALELARQLPLEEVIGTSVRNLVVLLDEQYFDRVPIDLYIAMEEQADRFGMTELACAAARLQGVELLRHGSARGSKAGPGPFTSPSGRTRAAAGSQGATGTHWVQRVRSLHRAALHRSARLSGRRLATPGLCSLQQNPHVPVARSRRATEPDNRHLP